MHSITWTHLPYSQKWASLDEGRWSNTLKTISELRSPSHSYTMLLRDYVILLQSSSTVVPQIQIIYTQRQHYKLAQNPTKTLTTRLQISSSFHHFGEEKHQDNQNWKPDLIKGKNGERTPRKFRNLPFLSTIFTYLVLLTFHLLFYVSLTRNLSLSTAECVGEIRSNFLGVCSGFSELPARMELPNLPETLKRLRAIQLPRN